MASTSHRDRVPPAQEKVVIARSGNRCAYPACGVELTFDASAVGDRPKAIGRVAHISAASPGGPRYDPLMSPEERGSANNLIYLCGTHHDAIDSQLGLHTTQFLSDAKSVHEFTVERAVRSVLGEISFEELAVVCAVVASAPPQAQELGIELALPVQEKITINGLGPVSAQRIRDGLSQAVRVEEFLAFQNKIAPSFGRNLVARFKSQYFFAIAEGLQGDAIFDYLVTGAVEQSGPVVNRRIEAAALAVVAYLFEICEIFERG